jgi:hypothetical protein
VLKLVRNAKLVHATAGFDMAGVPTVMCYEEKSSLIKGTP